MPRWVAGGLLLLAAWQAGGWVAALLEPVQTPQLPKLTWAPAEQQIFLLPSRLFAHADLARGQVEVRRKVTAAQLGIELMGVISFSNGEGVAIVRLKNGRQRAVRTGESIRQGLVLKQVEPDRVVVSMDGELVWVPIQQHSRRLVVEPNQQGVSAPAEVHGWVQPLRGKPFKLFEYLEVEPVADGVRIQARPGYEPQLRQLGLRNGDVIHSIDGQLVTRLMRQSQRWQQLFKQKRWRLRILRDGRYEEFEVNL